MPRPQFTLRALLVLLLAVACFFGGIRFQRELERRRYKSDLEIPFPQGTFGGGPAAPDAKSGPSGCARIAMPRPQFMLKTMLWAVGLVVVNVGLAIVTFVVWLVSLLTAFGDFRLD
jgi:hypothetical protein